MGASKKRSVDEVVDVNAPTKSVWKRPKKRDVQREMAQLLQKMPTPEDTICEFICRSMMERNRDDQLMALALLSSSDFDMTVQNDGGEDTATKCVSSAYESSDGDSSTARDSTSSTEKNSFDKLTPPLKPHAQTQVSRVCRWFNRVSEWPLMKKLRDFSL